ncbi:hypothetical protein [Cupriavidus taiwanensis]|uniref:hypothetical protein n=1 Tax=Cupriavidus taiwanensis TaxID=164546 RepID=UPI0039C01267
MALILTYGKEIVSLIVPLLTWALNRWFKNGPRLEASQPHAFTFVVDEPLHDDDGNVRQPQQFLHTSSHVLRNTGREAAKNVEVVFNWKPKCVNVWPLRSYETHERQQDGRFIVTFDSLAPGELIGFETMSINRDVPAMVMARCESGHAIFVPMSPQPMVSNTRLRFLQCLLVLGLGTAVYWSITVIQFLVLKTPLW